MKLMNLTGAGVAVAVLAIGGAFWAQAGDLNPPAGPVSSTMVTLDDIYGALQGGGAPTGDWSYYLSIPGVVGEVNIAGVAPDSMEVLDYSHTAEAPFSGGVPSAPQVGEVFINIRQDSSHPALLSLLLAGTQIPTVELKGYVNVNGSLVEAMAWTLSSARLTLVDAAGAGTTPGEVQLSFFPIELCTRQRAVSDQGNGPYRSFCWNLATASTCACPAL